jgi:endonuclease YncB( thermonuclease family)
MKSFTSFLIAISLTGCSLPNQPAAEPSDAKSLPTVVEVESGDTLTLDIEGRTVDAEITCIDAQRGGEQATNRLRELLPLGQAVQTRIVDDQAEPTTVELFLGNESVGLMLVREGFAAVDPATIDDCAATRELLLQAEENALQAGIGIWGGSLFDPSQQATLRSNFQFGINAESGNCPETVGVWEFLLGFEGGADHTVVADIAPFTTLPIEILQSEERRVIYQAPLTAEFASCVGTAQNEHLSMYSFEFGNGQVRFELDLTDDQGFREIRYVDTSANRPYVHWRAAE